MPRWSPSSSVDGRPNLYEIPWNCLDLKLTSFTDGISCILNALNVTVLAHDISTTS